MRKAPVKTLRMTPDLALRIDAWARANGKDSHSEAMRHLLEIALSAPAPQKVDAPAGSAQLSKVAINQIVDQAVERSNAMQRNAGRASKRKGAK